MYNSHVMELGLFLILPLVHLMVQAVILYNLLQLLFHRMADQLEHYPLALMEHWVACGKVVCGRIVWRR